VWGKEKYLQEIWWGNLKERVHLGDLGLEWEDNIKTVV
jgi:hypothetical protein